MVLAELTVFHLGLIVAAIFLLNLIAAIKQFKKCGPDEAIIRTGFGGASVAFTKGIIVVPVMHRYEVINIATRQLEFETQVTTSDGITQNVKCIFEVRVNQTINDVLTVVAMVGVETLADKKALLKLFEYKFAECLQVVAKTFTKEELEKGHMNYKDQVLTLIGTDLNGLTLEDMTLLIS